MLRFAQHDNVRWRLILVEPAVAVGVDEFVIAQPRIGLGDPGEFFGLPRRKDLGGIEAMDGGEKALPAEDLVNAGKAALEVIGGVEEGCIGIGQGGVFHQPLGGNLILHSGDFDFLEEFDRAFRPNAELTEKPADDEPPLTGKFPGREQIEDDVVVVAGVKRDVVAASLQHRSNHVDGLIAIEGGPF